MPRRIGRLHRAQDREVPLSAAVGKSTRTANDQQVSVLKCFQEDLKSLRRPSPSRKLSLKRINSSRSARPSSVRAPFSSHSIGLKPTSARTGDTVPKGPDPPPSTHNRHGATVWRRDNSEPDWRETRSELRCGHPATNSTVGQPPPATWRHHPCSCIPQRPYSDRGDNDAHCLLRIPVLAMVTNSAQLKADVVRDQMASSLGKVPHELWFTSPQTLQAHSRERRVR